MIISVRKKGIWVVVRRGIALTWKAKPPTGAT